jgi:hypothetical protein
MKNYIITILLMFCMFCNVYCENLPTISEPTILIPSPSLPPNIQCLRSNNNVDIIRFKDTYYVAWRSARVHFPDAKAIMYIISSKDFVSWKFEHSFKTGADLREPRFLVFRDQLFFYCFEGAKAMYSFNPKHIWISTVENGKWKDQVAPGMDGYVPWRLKMHNGKPLFSAYWGKNLYGAHQAQLRFFTSDDAINWKPISEQPQISVTGSEEGEFEFDEEGNMWCIVRLEGEGAMLCYADKDSLHSWKMYHTKKKYDSSCMFRHGKELYLVARRNRGGNAEKAPGWLPDGIRRTVNLTSYSFSPKTTALYKLNVENKDFDWVMDLPGCGDNAFPAVVPIDEKNYYILNYTNDLSNPDITWFSGQFQHTYIYYLTLSFPSEVE